MLFTGEFSGLLAPMFKCPQHGEVWRVETVEIIDTDRDDVNIQVLCGVCYDVVVPFVVDGLPVMHPLTDEQAYWEMMSADDPDEDDEDDEPPTPEEWLDDDE